MITRCIRRSHAAFTLVELIIAIGLLLILMLGIAHVFRASSETIGATHQVLSSMRDGRSAESVFRQDLSAAVTSNAPCIILRSLAQPGFRNRADELSDRDYSPGESPTSARQHILTIDLDADNREGDSPGERISPATYNSRNHRVDILSFFARQRAGRQTGGAGTSGPIIARQSADEQWIWYGHLWLAGNDAANPWPPPSGSPSVTFPGQGTFASNPNNFHAAQWILGRSAILLAQPAVDLGIYDRSIPPARQRYFCVTSADDDCPLAPLQAGAFDTDGRSSSRALSTATLEQSRYDLAGTTIDTFREQLRTWLDSNASGNWWDRMMCADVIACGSRLTGGRFQARSHLNSPLNAESAASQSPIFLAGCTQFAVEYTGDFLTQDASGGVIGAEPDGVIDYWKDPASAARQVRWYGLPRNVYAGNGTSAGPVIQNVASAVGPNGPNESAFRDVLPLRDVLQAAGLRSPASFERTLPTNGGANNYAVTMRSTDQYLCAWAPEDEKPRMIRIMLTVDDPQTRLAEGQTFEHVFHLP